MGSARNEILGWAEAGRIAPNRLRPALDALEAVPDAAAWRRFLDRALLWAGSVMLAAAAVFFFAYNWAELDRLAKFGLAQLPIVGALLLVWRLELDSTAGRAALFVAALLVGALLALVGQTYQTGADPWELFAVWAGAILPWTLLGRQPALLLLVLALAKLALVLYYQTFPGGLGLVSVPASREALWLLLGLNTGALVAWELASLRLAWLRARWAVRVLALAGGGFATLLCALELLDSDGAGRWATVAWAAWMAAAWLAYRRWRLDLFVLAGGVLSTVLVVTCFGALHIRGDGGTLLLTLLVIGLSAAGAFWLRTLAHDEGGE